MNIQTEYTMARPVPPLYVNPETKRTHTVTNATSDAIFRWRGYNNPITYKEAVDYLCTITEPQ